MKIMLIDDEENMHAVISSIVSKMGYEFCGFSSGEGAAEAIAEEAPDLVLLDVMLPQKDGFSICREARKRGARMPIVFLSARGEITDKAIGFSAGGDDYFSKPFDPRELVMHIQAILRREYRSASADKRLAMERLQVGDFQFDQTKGKVYKDGMLIDVTPKEYSILFTLACNAGETMSNEQLIEAAWGREYADDTKGLAVYIRRIRRKIEPDPSHPRYLRTSWGFGYVFCPDFKAT